MKNTTILDKHVESLKEEFDILGPKLNGLTYQKIINHMKRYGEEYATECVKASLGKAYENAEVGERTVCRTDFTKVNKQSITSPNNIILL